MEAGLTKRQTTAARFYGRFLVKEECRLSTGGGQALTFCCPGGQLIFNLPSGGGTNGEIRMCVALSLVG